MTLIEITPIKVNPWSAIAKWFGKVFNGEVLNKLDKMEQAQAETKIYLTRNHDFSCTHHRHVQYS